MVEWVNGLLSKHEGLSLDLEHSHKSWARQYVPIIAELGEVGIAGRSGYGQKDPRSSLASQHGQIWDADLWLQEHKCVRVLLCTCVHTQTHTHRHTHFLTHRYTTQKVSCRHVVV